MTFASSLAASSILFDFETYNENNEPREAAPCFRHEFDQASRSRRTRTRTRTFT